MCLLSMKGNALYPSILHHSEISAITIIMMAASMLPSCTCSKAVERQVQSLRLIVGAQLPIIATSESMNVENSKNICICHYCFIWPSKLDTCNYLGDFRHPMACCSALLKACFHVHGSTCTVMSSSQLGLASCQLSDRVATSSCLALDHTCWFVVYYNVCYTRPRLHLPLVLQKVLRRPKAQAKVRHV